MRYEITPLLFPWYNFDCSTIATSSRSSFLSNEDEVYNLCEEQKIGNMDMHATKQFLIFPVLIVHVVVIKNFIVIVNQTKKIVR